MPNHNQRWEPNERHFDVSHGDLLFRCLMYEKKMNENLPYLCCSGSSWNRHLNQRLQWAIDEQNLLLVKGWSKPSNKVLKSKWHCPIVGWYKSGFPPSAANDKQKWRIYQTDLNQVGRWEKERGSKADEQKHITTEGKIQKQLDCARVCVCVVFIWEGLQTGLNRPAKQIWANVEPRGVQKWPFTWERIV